MRVYSDHAFRSGVNAAPYYRPSWLFKQPLAKFVFPFQSGSKRGNLRPREAAIAQRLRAGNDNQCTAVSAAVDAPVRNGLMGPAYMSWLEGVRFDIKQFRGSLDRSPRFELGRLIGGRSIARGQKNHFAAAI